MKFSFTKIPESDFFYKVFKSNKKNLAGGKGGGRVGKGDGLSKLIFFTKNRNRKFGVGAGWGRWTDRRTGPNQFAPSTSSKLGA